MFKKRKTEAEDDSAYRQTILDKWNNALWDLDRLIDAFSGANKLGASLTISCDKAREIEAMLKGCKELCTDFLNARKSMEEEK